MSNLNCQRPAHHWCQVNTLYCFFILHNWACIVDPKVSFHWQVWTCQTDSPYTILPQPQVRDNAFTQVPAHVNIMFVTVQCLLFCVQVKRCRSQLVWLFRRSRERSDSFGSIRCWSTTEDTMTPIQVTVVQFDWSNPLINCFGFWKKCNYCPESINYNSKVHW